MIFVFRKTFYKPFGDVIKSLNNNNLDSIKPYINHNDEIGQLSGLIEDFFKQRISLQNEIEERKLIMAQIAEKNEELLQQNEEIQTLNEDITQQKEIIERVHKNITDSINYAKTIQEALLTSNELMHKYLKDSFLIFKPKEVVSGDFYYINKIGDNLIFTVADCTGHGVPGGFMTILGISYLHQIVDKEITFDAGDILNKLRERFKKLFRTFGSQNTNGLDIVLCSVNLKTNILQYAGANNPLYIISENELYTYKATKNPVGYYPKEIEFKSTEIHLENNDILYLCSDGYRDQLGGKLSRSFTSKKFNEMIFENHEKPLEEQKQILEDTLYEWRNGFEQIDDIAILGVRWKIDNEIS